MADEGQGSADAFKAGVNAHCVASDVALTADAFVPTIAPSVASKSSSLEMATSSLDFSANSIRPSTKRSRAGKAEIVWIGDWCFLSDKASRPGPRSSETF